MTAEELYELGFKRQYHKYGSTYHLRIKDVDGNPTDILFIATWVNRVDKYGVFIRYNKDVITFTKESDIKLFIEILERNYIHKDNDYY